MANGGARLGPGRASALPVVVLFAIGFAAPLVVEHGEPALALGASRIREAGESGHRIGHVLGAAELEERERA